MITVALAVLIWAIAADTGDDSSVSTETMRGAVERSLPYLARVGAEWIAEKKCNSCHVVPLLVWSHNEALARGFDVDRKKLSEWSNWAVDDALKTTKPSERSGADALALILLGRRSENEPTADNDNQKVRSLLLDWQEPDGSWHAQKQFKGLRWTDVEMHEATTMWCLLALMQDDASDERTVVRRERALSFLRKESEAKTVASVALPLLLAHRLGDAGRVRAISRELISRQNDDGGWGWMRESESEAFSTGQALYALTIVEPDNRDVSERALRFLLTTQQEDGSWHVESLGREPTNLNVYPYWGTAWATIAILQSLPTYDAQP